MRTKQHFVSSASIIGTMAADAFKNKNLVRLIRCQSGTTLSCLVNFIGLNSAEALLELRTSMINNINN